MSEVTIRGIESRDAAAWRRLWTAYLTFYETRVPEAVYEATWQRLRTPDAPIHGFVAVDADDKPVGLVHYLFHAHCWKTRDVCYLQDLYVEEGQRGRGVARALMEAVFAAADRAGCPDVYWMTQDHNHQARTLYDRIGRLTDFIKYTR
jgi:GNAT superfamily N-acetyltransferase